MNKAIPGIIPADDGMKKEEYDFAYSNAIRDLGYEKVLNHFGSIDHVIDHYEELLANNMPRSSAFFISTVIKKLVLGHPHDVLMNVFSANLSLQIEHDIDILEKLILKTKKPSKRTRIMFCSGHWLTGGMERVLSLLFDQLKDDYDIFLLTPYTDTQSRITVPDYVTSIRISSEMFVKHFDSLILAYALLLDINVVIGFMNMFAKQLNFYNISVGTDIKTVASNHEYYFYPYKSAGHYEVVKKRLEAFSNCTAIVWPLNFNAALCGLYVKNNYVIGNPNNPYFIQDGLKTPKDEIVLCVGRFDDYVKRIDRILECFALVIKKVPSAKLVIVGKYNRTAAISPHSPDTINDLIINLAIPEESIKFVGEVNNVDEYYSRAKVLLLTSNSEGFGMVVNEAAQFGVPTVCNYIPGIEDLVVNGTNGYVVEQGDMETMSEKVCDLLKNEKLRAKLGRGATKLVHTYEPSIIGDKWRFLIDSITKTGDVSSLGKRLNSRLGYKVSDQQLFMKILSTELNEIFYMATQNAYQRNHGYTHTLLLKIKRLPRRLSENIKFEGIIRTCIKIVSRSYKIVRKKVTK